MTDEREKQSPPFIQISGDGTIGDMNVSANKVVGYGSLLKSEGVSIDTLSVSDNLHVSVTEPSSVSKDNGSPTVNEHWYKRPLGQIALSVTSGLLLAAAIWAFNHYFG